MHTKHRGRGFTLIELLVVVAIIAGLIAILIPSLSQARANAYKTKCATNMRSLAMADQQYGNEWGVFSRDSGLNVGPIPRVESVFYLLAADQGIPLVPQAGNGNFESEYYAAFGKVKWLRCPSFPDLDHPVCFTVNAFDPKNVGTEIAFLPTKRIFRPSEVANFAEANATVPKDQFDVYDAWQQGHVDYTSTTPVAAGGSGDRISNDKRHRGDINLSFYDAHVESKPFKKTGIRDFTGN